MGILELLTLNVGFSVSKAIFKVWTKDHPVLQDVGVGIAGLIASKIQGFGEKREVTRQFEAIADEIARKLEPLITVEFQQLPNNEIDAAIIAVGDAINNTSIDIDNILSNDFDPIQIEKLISERDEPNDYFLSSSAEELYRIIVRESCNYIVEVAITLPNFNSKSITEILSRETQIISLVKDVLNRLPDIEDTGSTEGGEDSTFEREYRRYLARKLDWLELYGIDLDPAHMRYALSVGYISLTASKIHGVYDEFDLNDQEMGIDQEIGLKSTSKDTDEDKYLDIETALSNENRVLIRGEAGSGKTTLLQWLAVRGANRDFEGILENWNGVVPFFIQLRRFVESGLPKPEDFLENLVPNIVGIMPVGWVHRCLCSGNALVLIDGVDELPEGMRNGARIWLEDLTEEFAETRFIVTSRPPAVSSEWLDDLNFAHCELQALTLSDIDKFIDHWHMAAYGLKGNIDSQNDEIGSLKKKLKLVIRDNRPIRSLATSPLLCAMLCALNRDRREQIPQDRLSLYKVALEMLLERRDAARNIEIDEISPPTLVEKKLLLQSFAYWLIINGHSDSSRSKAEGKFLEKIETMVGVNCSGVQMYRYLLLRSGVIREAVEGRVDFIHRTFQEYLAAEEAVHRSCIGQLIENAHLDQWKEVIVLGCGHARKDEREELINGIIDRGDNEYRFRHRLHLLAITCLETSPELDPSVITKLESRLKKLVPPKSMTEARSLASSGDLAIPLIEKLGRQNVRIQAACIRTLALIGGDKV
ncbi:MAG: NACHT domain-containing protein [Alphaproteobacteria bacterium]|nr:NACHT domain-containing protein [Alphaproteobacteria bacterium]MBT4084262.1 NACHT domain-containing protein [Alphaproteobacteria bacterium]MBT4347089.1 NACHT domain-containing protein [Euryarchaeota archaeon]MBT4545777.1 NACHT domain-containing protein [Alphaproteobacteria bacterium]MBT7746593.1 NACHT domain-containing protein [Alphaproteobacteria bacterium]